MRSEECVTLRLTRQDVLVAVLALVLWPLSLFPRVEELALLLLQHLGTQSGEGTPFTPAAS